MKDKKMKVLYNKILITITTAVCLFASPLQAAENDDSALESYNRAMFNFNSVFDEYIFKPVAKGYRAVTNEFVRERVHDFFENLKEPTSAINHTLQGDFSETGNSLGRFAINTTLGLLGTFDVASGWGMEKNKTGFDKTLAKWCVPDGPFIMLPFLGPSTARATVGEVADIAANPISWGHYYTQFGNDWERYSFFYGLTALGFISVREANIELIDNLTANSVDPYSTIKSAYIQNRLKIGACAFATEDKNSADYDFDFDEDFDDE